MKTPHANRRRFAVILPLLLLLSVIWHTLRRDEASGDSADAVVSGFKDEGQASAPSPEAPEVPVAPSTGQAAPPAASEVWAMMDSDGFTPRTRELAAALDAG